jgi:hypothetical protein
MAQTEPIVYNGKRFALERGAKGWNIAVMGGGTLGTGLFEGASEEQARAKALVIIRDVHPVGIRLVGPDVTRSTRVGDLRLVPPNVTRANFIHWDQDSVLP